MTISSVTEAARRSSPGLMPTGRTSPKIDALDPAGLSKEAAFERDVERHNVRRAIFDADRLRIWERRSTALDTVGDGLFLLFARDHAPLTERLDAIAGRLEAVATYLEEAKTRADRPAGPALAADRDRDGRRAAGFLRRARGCRQRHARTPGAAAPPARQ